jgi:hypothetical protein
MADPLLPSAEQAPSLPADATPKQRIEAWLDLLNTGHKLVLAGLRREVGPDGDVETAYRQWYARQMEEHDRKLARMLQRLNGSRDAS